MPNFVGIWSPQLPEEKIQGTIAKQLDRVRVSGSGYREYTATFPGFGMALQDHNLLENGDQPASSPDGQSVLLLDGEINNANELGHQFSADLSKQRLLPPDLALELI